MKMKKGFRQLVDEAKARITTIGLDEAKRRHATCASWSARA